MSAKKLHAEAQELLSSYTGDIELQMLQRLSGKRYGFALMEPYIPGVGMGDGTYYGESVDVETAMSDVSYTFPVLCGHDDKYVALTPECALEMSINHAINTTLEEDLKLSGADVDKRCYIE